MYRISFFLFSLLIYTQTFACICDALPPISEKQTERYKVIARGKVDSVDLEANMFYFNITELYKGAVESEIMITFDDSSSCMMSFEKGEEWLIYANYRNFDELSVSQCEHSRKLFKNVADDYYQFNATRTFEEESDYLTTILGLKAFRTKTKINQLQTQFSHKNIQPEPKKKLVLIAASLIIMVIIYLITRNKK